MKSLNVLVGRRRYLITGLLAISIGLIWVVAAAADSGDVKVNSPAPGQHPFQTAVATVNADKTVMVRVTGGWSWPTHGKDCNLDRSGAGISVNWFDSKDRGYHVAFFDLNGDGVVNTTPGGPDDFGVGSTNATGLNSVDNVVHPTENDTGAGNVQDITSPSAYANWRGGCGVFTSDTIRQSGGTYTTGLVAHGNFGKAAAGDSDASGAPFSNPTPPSNPLLQGALLQHTYKSVSDLSRICALTYDVHAGTYAQKLSNGAYVGTGVGIPGKASEVTAGDTAVPLSPNSTLKYTSIHNTDNSIQSNGGTPAGNTCPSFVFPSVKTTPQAGGTLGSEPDSFNDQATVSGASSSAVSTVTFTLYKDADNSCKTSVATSTKNITGNGSVTSDSYDPTPADGGAGAGTYEWVANYAGDAAHNSAPAASGCGDEPVTLAKAPGSVATTESLQVTENITVSANAGVSAGDTVRVRLFSGTCVTGSEDKGTPAPAGSPLDQTVTLDASGNADASVDISAPGDYYWFVEYLGNSNVTSANGGCTETFSVHFPTL